MPRKTQTKRKCRPRRRRKCSVRKPLPLGGFAARKLVKLRYVQNFTLDATALVPAIQQFRANSVYDPDKTGTGHQPSNYDKLSTIYDRYTVLGSRLRCYYVAQSDTNLVPPCLAIGLSEDGDQIFDSYTAGGIENVLEQNRLRYYKGYVGAPTSGTTPMLSINFSAKKFFGVKTLVGEHPYSAGVNTTPTEGALFNIAAISQDGSADPSAVLLRAEIDYIIMFTEPKITDAS